MMGRLFGSGSHWRRRAALLGAGVMAVTLTPIVASAQAGDPREGLAPDASAASNLEHVSNTPKEGPFAASFNSDLAFTGDFAIAGSYAGFQVYDISGDVPVLRTSFLCPGGQGDVSVYGNLLFTSVEQTSGRIDCGTGGASGSINPERFRGVRIFDISDIDNPVQLPGVQTCRGSHTHTIVTDPDDAANIYIYNSGTSSVRNPGERPELDCQNAGLTQDPVTTGNPTQWRIDVIRVPLAAPETAAIVSQPRIFTDPDTGAFNGLQNTLPGQEQHPSGSNYSPTPNTNTCHDVTSYAATSLVAGACQGNGVLLDASDPVNPVRLDAVSDPNFSYWHSATFNNDGTKVIFTDEWGGGSGARCLDTHLPEWGADALFDIVGTDMQFASYFKLPAAQTDAENCVAHNGSIVPVPGRDVMVQAWYQGGLSVIDFTDTANPVEIAYFDRGPIAPANLGGFWSTYWYNGAIYGTEIYRGFDKFTLSTSDFLSENELASAESVQLAEFNAQHQPTIQWPASFAVSRTYLEQATENGALHPLAARVIDRTMDLAERLDGYRYTDRLVAATLRVAILLVPRDVQDLRQSLIELEASYR